MRKTLFRKDGNKNTKRDCYRPCYRSCNMASYYYWDDNYRTEDGLTLQECHEQFGTQVASLTRKGFRHAYKYKVINLDKSKSLGKSWMLWMKNNKGVNIPVALYEKDAQRVPGTI